jgi:hypothetical protein
LEVCKFYKKKTKTNIPDCMKYNNVTSTNTSKLVKLFADYFSSIYEKNSLSSNVMLSNLSSNTNQN